jgi:predicted nuclease of predicted toxin-antitoxin system
LNLLVDESLSRRVARLLATAGHDAVHIGDLGLLGAADASVMDAAREAGRVLVSADTDFGELLALGSYAGPSVVLLRRSPHGAEAQMELLLAGLKVVADDLTNGAMSS